MSKYIDIDGLSTFLANIREEYSLGSIMGSSAIGSTSAYPYWTGSSWATQSLSDYALKSDIPTIPSLSGYATEQWVLDRGYLTSASLDALETAVDNNATDIGDHENRIATIEDNYAQKSAIPTSLSDLANDVGYITASAIPTSYAWSAITGKPDFAAVATSGSYNDLSNKPSIPSIAGLASESWVTSNFLGLGGGTISGNLDITGYFKIKSHYFFVRDNDNADWLVTDKNWQHEYTLIHSGNVSSYNAGSATKLQTARTIWGQSFDGTGNVDGHAAFTFDDGQKIIIEKNAGGSSYCGISFFNNGFKEGSITASTLMLNPIRGGNVGIGTDSPAYKLDVNGPIAGHEIYSFAGWMTLLGTENVSYSTYLDNKNQYGLKIHYGNGVAGAFFSQDGNTYFYGNLTSSESVKVNNIEYLNLRGFKSNNSESVLGFHDNSPIILSHNGVIRFGITDYNSNVWYQFNWDYSTKNLTIKPSEGTNMTTNFTGNITASGTIYSAVGMYSPGYISARSTAGSSDRNLKTNVAPVRNALAYILGTKYVSFDWKDTGEHSVGIIAQDELNREWSCLVQKYSEHYSYQYTQHTALIGSALQEEDKKVEALKTEVATLKAEVATLKAEVQRLRNERQLWQQ